MFKHDEIIKRLEARRTAFEDNDYVRPNLRDTKRWRKLLQNGDARLSRGGKSVRRRAQALVTSILQNIGPEVLLLVLFSLPARELASLQKEKKTFLLALQTWWSGVTHPQAIAVIASEQQFTTKCLVPVTPTARQSLVDSIPTNRQDASAAFEVAIHLAAESIPGTQDRTAWVTTALTHSYLLKHLSGLGDEIPPPMVAAITVLDNMEEYIGRRLYQAVQASRMRSRESDALTLALPLHLADSNGDDYVLEIWICSTYGHVIVEAIKTMRSVDDWQDILGNYLYLAMKYSKARMTEEREGLSYTAAVTVDTPNGDEYDSRLLVNMSFNMGRELWANRY